MEFIKKGIAKFLFWASYPVLRLIYPAKITWEDKEATKAVLQKSCVVFSNHRSYVEGLFISRLLRKYKVYTYVGLDWYSKKSINWLFRNMNYIPVDREQMDTAWLDRGLEVVNKGNSIYILPEGHTRRDGQMDEFKPGFLILAKRADVPLVPIYLDGNFPLFHMTRIVIGKPLHPDLNEEGRPSLVMKKHCKACREYIIGMQERLQGSSPLPAPAETEEKGEA